jgi:blue light- and temperature-responsive anti-repressor
MFQLQDEIGVPMKKTNMAGALYRLIYCSRNVIMQAMPDAALEDEIRAILVTARRCNKADNITGALLFTGSGFAQVLEGTRDVVERTFERISGDPRHADVTVLSFTPTECRSFPDWPMGFSGQTSFGAADPLTLLLAGASFAGPRATTGSDVLRMLERVVQREDEWIAA